MRVLQISFIGVLIFSAAYSVPHNYNDYDYMDDSEASVEQNDNQAGFRHSGHCSGRHHHRHHQHKHSPFHSSGYHNPSLNWNEYHPGPTDLPQYGGYGAKFEHRPRTPFGYAGNLPPLAPIRTTTEKFNPSTVFGSRLTTPGKSVPTSTQRNIPITMQALTTTIRTTTVAVPEQPQNGSVDPADENDAMLDIDLRLG